MNTQPANAMASALEGADWAKSSYSNNGGNCVEVAQLTHAFAIRDSKVPDGPALLLPTSTFHAFIDGVREGDLDS